MSVVAHQRAPSPTRSHTKRGRNTLPHSFHAASVQSQSQRQRGQSGSGEDQACEGRKPTGRIYLKLSSHAAAAPSHNALPAISTGTSHSHYQSHSYSSSASSALDSTIYSPNTSPLSPSRRMDGCGGTSFSDSYSSSPLSSSQLATPPSSFASYGSEPYRSPEQSLKRLCVNNMDSYPESADDDVSQSSSRPHHSQPPSHYQLQALSASSSFSSASSSSRVMVKAKRSSMGSPSASVTPCQSRPASRPSTASSSSMIRASFNLSEPAFEYSQSIPANSAPTSTHASPHPSAASSPQTRYTSILSSSVPAGPQSFLSLLNVSCASANSTFSSPAHSPCGFLSSSQATPSSAHSSASCRPHILTAQERAALFPSRSVTSSPIPPDGGSSQKRTSTGKRSGMDPPTLTSAAVDVSRRASDGGRQNNKRMKEDRLRDRRRSIGNNDQGSGEAADECDDMLLQLSLQPAADSPSNESSRLSLVIGSSNSLSSLDSPSSSSSYPRMSAPLNSPVSGNQARRAGHIAAGHLLGTAAAAAGVARRRNSGGSLYEEEEDQGLVDAVGAMQLCGETSGTKAEEEKEATEPATKLPSAPRLASRSTTLRLSLASTISQPSGSPTESDSENTYGEADDDSVVLSSSPVPSRQQSSPAEYYESYIPSTGSFSKVLRAQRQSQLFGSSSSSSTSSSSSPFPRSPVLSPFSPLYDADNAYMSGAAATNSAVVMIAPLSPVASTTSSSYSSLSSSLSGTLSSSFATGPRPSLSPFALLPDYPPAFSRSLSHAVDPRRLVVGNGQHTGGGGGADKRHSRGAGESDREGAGDGVGLDVPFLKELSLPPRGPGRRVAMS